MAVANQSQIYYRPDELVVCSGVYRTTHTSPRCVQHDAVLRTGDHFPECPHCGKGVWYVLIQAVPHIDEDPDLCGT
jgi:hypothetical protein